MTHALKTWPEYYELVTTGKKTFEIRKMDRDFKTGDKLLLQEYDPKIEKYSGRETEFEAGVIVEGFGIKKGFGVIQLIERNP